MDRDRKGLIVTASFVLLAVIVNITLFSLFLSYHLSVGFWDLIIADLWFLLVLVSLAFVSITTISFFPNLSNGDGPRGVRVKRVQIPGRGRKKGDGNSGGRILNVVINIIADFLYAIFISAYFRIDLIRVLEGFIWWALIVIIIMVILGTVGAFIGAAASS